MKSKFNYITLLAIFSLPALSIFFSSEVDTTIAISFGYLAYLGYLKVPMDELFIKRIMEAATLTLMILLLSLSTIYLIYYFVDSSDTTIFTSFWVHFMLTHVVFNVLLVGFIAYDNVRTSHG